MVLHREFQRGNLKYHIFGISNLNPPAVINYNGIDGKRSLFGNLKDKGHRYFARLVNAELTEQCIYFFVLYFGLALLFALLLAADPRGILAYGDPREKNTFEDCFFLSVQAMSTIGFGAIGPKSTYSNIIVSLLSFVSILYISLLTAVFVGNLLTPIADWSMSDCACLWYDSTLKRYIFQVRIIFAPGTIYTNMKAHATAETFYGTTRTQATVTKPLSFENDVSLVRTTMWVLTHVIDESSPMYGAATAVLGANESDIDDVENGKRRSTRLRKRSSASERLRNEISRFGYNNEDLARHLFQLTVKVKGTDPRYQASTETVHIFGVSNFWLFGDIKYLTSVSNIFLSI